MYSHSRKWVNPEVLENEKAKKLNNARFKLCPDSEAWTQDFDLEAHKKAYGKDVAKYYKKQKARAEKAKKEKLERELLGWPVDPEVKIKPPFGGKKFNTNFGPVLGKPTVFCPEFKTDRYKSYNPLVPKELKEVAPWPCREEQKYEGDDRISTDPLHRRYLGLPRVPGNNTVNWMQRSVIDQYPLDDFYVVPDADEVFWMFHTVDDYFEFTDQEGREAIGNELMDMLNE